MTRQSFIDEVATWEDLIRFCSDENVDFCDDIYSEESKNIEIDNCLEDWACNHTWEELRSILEDIPTGYEYYLRDEWDNWVVADYRMFESRKAETLEWMDEQEYWPEEENNDTSPFDIDDDEGDIFEPSDVTSILELLTSCNDKFKIIGKV